MIGVGPTQCVKEESFREWSVSFSACRPHAFPTCRADNLWTVFSKSGHWPPAPGLPEVLIKHADCQQPPCVRNLHFQLSPRGLLPSKFEKSGFKDLELPITSDPRNISAPATEVHWSFWGLVISYSALGTLAPTALMGNRTAVVSTGADRLVCAQPSQGRP